MCDVKLKYLNEKVIQKMPTHPDNINKFKLDKSALNYLRIKFNGVKSNQRSLNKYCL